MTHSDEEMFSYERRFVTPARKEEAEIEVEDV